MHCLTALPSQCPVQQVSHRWLRTPARCVFTCGGVCACARPAGMEVVSGEMSSSDYRLRQFSNYSVKHQSWGLMQAVLRPDGQCNHQRGGRELPPLSLPTSLSCCSLHQVTTPTSPPSHFRSPRPYLPLLFRHLVRSLLLPIDTFDCTQFQETGEEEK